MTLSAIVARDAPVHARGGAPRVTCTSTDPRRLHEGEDRRDLPDDPAHAADDGAHRRTRAHDGGHDGGHPLMARPFSRRAGRPRSRGQALVEVAIILPVFLLMLMILFDFGRVIYAQHTITQDAREAVRRGVVSTRGPRQRRGLPDRYAGIRDAAQVMAPAVPIGDTDIFGAPGLCTTPLPVDPTVVGTCFYPNGITAATLAHRRRPHPGHGGLHDAGGLVLLPRRDHRHGHRRTARPVMTRADRPTGPPPNPRSTRP